MNRVETVCVHVVGKPAGAPDTGDEHNIFARDAEFRHYLLYLRQDCVVAASGTPAYFLVRNEILASKCTGHAVQPSRARLRRLVNSLTLNGRPWILLQPTASMR